MSLVAWLRKELHTFVRDTKGATAIIISFSTVVLTGSITFGVDAANWYQTDRRLQTGSDVAAMAAAANPIVDPYSDLLPPAPAPCDYNNVSGVVTTKGNFSVAQEYNDPSFRNIDSINVTLVE